MARHEGEWRAEAPEPLTPEQVLELLGPVSTACAERSEATARFLAGGEGWKAALAELGGAFAREERGLIDDQSE